MNLKKKNNRNIPKNRKEENQKGRKNLENKKK